MISSDFKGVSASAWVGRFLPHVPEGGRILDIACGAGRHIALARAAGYPVTAVDRDIDALSRFADDGDVRIVEADLESGGGWPLAGERFAGVIVTNYLYRPLFPVLLESIAQGGALIYETFARGNEKFGRPRNPDFLLRPGELLDLCRPSLTVIAYEHLEIARPAPAMVQRVCAIR